MKVLPVLGAAIMLGILGQLLFKLGVDKVGSLSIASLASVQTLKRIAFSPVLLGLAAYLASTAFYLVALSRQELTKTYPLISLTYLGTAAGGFLLLGERFSAPRMAGILLIVAGCYMVVRF